MERVEEVREAIARIERSTLSAQEYIQRYGAPFSLAQFYRYRARIASEGEEGLKDRRHNEHRRKLKQEQSGFIRGFIKNNQKVTLAQVQQAVITEFGITVNCSTISRTLKKLGIRLDRRGGERRQKEKERVSGAGFELVAALAVHLGWHEHTAAGIQEVVASAPRATTFWQAGKKEKREGPVYQALQSARGNSQDAVCGGSTEAGQEEFAKNEYL